MNCSSHPISMENCVGNRSLTAVYLFNFTLRVMSSLLHRFVPVYCAQYFSFRTLIGHILPEWCEYWIDSPHKRHRYYRRWWCGGEWGTSPPLSIYLLTQRVHRLRKSRLFPLLFNNIHSEHFVVGHQISTRFCCLSTGGGPSNWFAILGRPFYLFNVPGSVAAASLVTRDRLYASSKM